MFDSCLASWCGGDSRDAGAGVEYVAERSDAKTESKLERAPSKKLESAATVSIVSWLDSYEPFPLNEAAWTYPTGQTFVAAKHATSPDVLKPLYGSMKDSIAVWLQSQDFLEEVYEVFRACDLAQKGRLSWRTGEAREFVVLVFHSRQYPGLPDTFDMSELFSLFDAGGTGEIGFEAACYLAHAVLACVYKSFD